MRCKRNERAAGEKARLGRGDGASVIAIHLIFQKNYLACFCIYENRYSPDFELRQPSRSAHAARQPKAAGNEKRGKTAFTAERTRHGFRPDRETRPPVT